MIAPDAIAQLKALSEGFTLLYVEDNEGLRIKAHRLMQKFFANTIAAADGEEGLELFKKHQPQIVITDIRMPKLDGLAMIERIKAISPSTRFIIATAFDESEYLHRAIKIGVFDYMAKPVKIDVLIDTLKRCIESIKSEENGSIFNSYMNDMLNYQSDPLALISEECILFVNQMFLDFFDVDTLNAFNEKYTDFGTLLLPHKGFLYNHDDIEWFKEASKDSGKLFHTKIADSKGKNRHFILKMHALPKKEGMYIMSLNDISDLNLLSLFDSNAVKNDEKLRSLSTILNLMQVIQKNSAEVKIHNFYKGLTITNPGLIAEVEQDRVVAKSSFMQLKAATHQRNILISSEIFPSAILCEPLEKVDLDNQAIIFKQMRFVPRSPVQRKSVRVFPEEHHTVSLFFEERKFHGDVTIYDLSIEATKLELNALPAGLKTGMKVVVDMVLEHDRKPIIIHVEAEVFRIDELPRTFYVVLKLNPPAAQKKLLIEYVARRQMNLIREFKGMQIG